MNESDETNSGKTPDQPDDPDEHIETTEPYVIPHRNAHDTELAAAAKARGNYPRLGLVVLNHLVQSVQDYDNHGSAVTGIHKDSYAPARHWLVREGFVEKTGEKVPNERGNMCTLWAPNDLGIRYWKQERDTLPAHLKWWLNANS